MRPFRSLPFMLLALAGCAVPETAPVSSSPNHLTLCVNDYKPSARQRAEDMAMRQCAARGLVQRAVSSGACPPSATAAYNAMTSIRYECARL